jgi:membrane protease YdiL (CAAX protease family)
VKGLQAMALLGVLPRVAVPRAQAQQQLPLGTQGQRLGEAGPGALGRRRPALLILAAYLTIGGVAAALTVALGRDPLRCESWLGFVGPASMLVSLGLGVCVGALTVAGTRVLVQRVAWARALHEALRPAVKGAGDGWLVAIAVASALGEELLFRGLLVPVAGVMLSSLLFGALHQVSGQARWGWAAWATGMGLLFAVIYAATGSLVGPIAAHLAINAANLRFLRDTDPAPRARQLGGLLGRRP